MTREEAQSICELRLSMGMICKNCIVGQTPFCPYWPLYREKEKRRRENGTEQEQNR